MFPMRHRYACVSRTGDGRGDSRDNFEWDTCIRDYLCLLRSSSEHKRIPALHTTDLPSFGRLANHQRGKFLLANLRVATCFTDINNFGIVPCPTEGLWICQMIVNDNIGNLDTLLRSQSDQAQVARPGTNQINFPARTL